jgi:hypothetical protein
MSEWCGGIWQLVLFPFNLSGGANHEHESGEFSL